MTGGTHLAVKVEGVLLHGNKPTLFRTAAGIVLTVTTQLTARAGLAHDFKVFTSLSCNYFMYVVLNLVD